MIKIKNNFLIQKDFNAIKDMMLSSRFPWYYNNTKVDKEDDDNDLNNYQLTHTVFADGLVNSSAYNLIEPVLQKLKVKEVIRIKANLVPRTSRIHKFEKHADQDYNCKGAILYINSNNGHTIFKDKKVASKKNTIVLFNANQEHQGTTCTNEKIRVLINFNYR
jgi:hypothetical protein